MATASCVRLQAVFRGQAVHADLVATPCGPRWPSCVLSQVDQPCMRRASQWRTFDATGRQPESMSRDFRVHGIILSGPLACGREMDAELGIGRPSPPVSQSALLAEQLKRETSGAKPPRHR